MLFEEFGTDFYYKYVSENVLGEFYINDVGFERCSGKKAKEGPFVKNHYILHYCLKGKGYYNADGTVYEIRAGDVFLIPPLKVISYYPDREDPWWYYWFEYNGINAAKINKSLLLTEQAPVYRVKDIEEAERVGYEMFRRLDVKLDDFTALAYCFRFFSLLARERGEVVTAGRTVKEDHVRRALTYIADNYHKYDLGAREISDRLFLNASYLSRIFHEVTGTSIVKYILDFRLQKACKLLEQKDLSVQAVAYSVGFDNPFYFTRKFSQVFHFPPSKYQNRCDMRGGGEESANREDDT